MSPQLKGEMGGFLTSDKDPGDSVWPFQQLS